MAPVVVMQKAVVDLEHFGDLPPSFEYFDSLGEFHQQIQIYCSEIRYRHVLTFTTYTLRPEVCTCKITREGGTNRARVPSGARARRGKRTQRSRIMVDISV